MRGWSNTFLLLLAAFLLAVVPVAPTAAAHPLDADHDVYPDLAELLICGSDLSRLVVNGGAVPGECASPTDYQEGFPVFLLWFAQYYAQGGSNLSDGNADGVPDGVDFLLCHAVENKNFAFDGSCEGDDYFLP